jgi:hypothetical protein
MTVTKEEIRKRMNCSFEPRRNDGAPRKQLITLDGEKIGEMIEGSRPKPGSLHGNRYFAVHIDGFHGWDIDVESPEILKALDKAAKEIAAVLNRAAQKTPGPAIR